MMKIKKWRLLLQHHCAHLRKRMGEMSPPLHPGLRRHGLLPHRAPHRKGLQRTCHSILMIYQMTPSIRTYPCRRPDRHLKRHADHLFNLNLEPIAHLAYGNPRYSTWLHEILTFPRSEESKYSRHRRKANLLLITNSTKRL